MEKNGARLFAVYVAWPHDLLGVYFMEGCEGEMKGVTGWLAFTSFVVVVLLLLLFVKCMQVCCVYVCFMSKVC